MDKIDTRELAEQYLNHHVCFPCFKICIGDQDPEPTKASLEQVLSYHNSRLMTTYATQYNYVSYKEVEYIFKEMLKWLYLCTKDNNIFITSDYIKIDQMWHCFILHTKDYADFCQQYFGQFIHHIPTDRVEVNPFRKRHRLEILTELYNNIQEHLGPETLIEWTSGRLAVKEDEA